MVVREFAKVKIEETPEEFRLIIDPTKYALEFPVDIGEAKGVMAIGIAQGERNIENLEQLTKDVANPTRVSGIKIKEVIYPKHLYRIDGVLKAAERLEAEMEKGECKSCTVVSAVEGTRKSFLIPTLRDFLEDCLGCEIGEDGPSDDH